MAAAEQPRPGSETATPRWQRAFAAFGLTLVTLFVAGPVSVVLLLLWIGILGVAGAQILETAGVLRGDAFAASLAVSAVIVGGAALASLAVRLPGALRRRPAAPRVQGPSRPEQWLLRHPWFSVGLLLLATDVVLVPLDRSGALDVHSVLVGTALIGAGFWLAGSLAYALLRGWALVLRVVWTGVRSSSFFAGIVVLGSLFVTAGANLLWGSVTHRAGSFAEAQPERGLGRCGPSALECSRTALLQVAGKGRAAPPPVTTPAMPSTPVVAPLVTPLAVPELPTPFDRCIEELHRSGPGFESARQAGIRLALARSTNEADAEDLVHSMMLSVCQGAERIADVRPYFLRSVQNAVLRQKRSSRKWCPLDPDDPPPGTEVCIIDSLLKQAVQEQMEGAAYQALCELSAEERRLVEMRLWDNLSHAEIGARLGVTEATARKRFSRVQVALKEKFDRRCR